MSGALNLWDQHLPEWWQYYLANFYSQETASMIADAMDPRAEWPQSVDAPTASQRSPILEYNQNPERTPLTSTHGSFDGNFGNQAAAMPDCYTHTEYNQHIMIQEEDIQLTGRQLPDPGIGSPSTPGCNVQLVHTHNANTLPSDERLNQVPRQHWEGSAPPQAMQKGLIGDKTSVAVGSAFGLSTSTARARRSRASIIKNATEIEVRDGAALVRYFAWLEEQLSQGVKL
ncbi:hypothetical protein EI94DRAFT_1800997 [Lactarius quietus]|nr:hypothetical protein EI94DRAFT_1800997 [Lactarius quietus]